MTAVSEPEPGRYRIGSATHTRRTFWRRDLLDEVALPPGDQTCRRPALEFVDRGRFAASHGRTEPGDFQLRQWLTHFLEAGFIVFTRRADTGRRPCSRWQAPSASPARPISAHRSMCARPPQASDLAYTSLPLDPHTDNPYRDPVPGVQLLHCLRQRDLGRSVDAGRRVRRRAGTEIAGSGGIQGAFIHGGTIPGIRIRLRSWSRAQRPSRSIPPARIMAIHFSPRLDFVPLRPPEELADYYRARRAFDHLLSSPEFEIRFLLAPGELLMMDNRRLLHGRTGFDPSEGERHLQGCYIDIDGPRSLYRVVRRRLSGQST